MLQSLEGAIFGGIIPREMLYVSCDWQKEYEDAQPWQNKRMMKEKLTKQNQGIMLATMNYRARAGENFRSFQIRDEVEAHRCV